jgi:hypothetical protein
MIFLRFPDVVGYERVISDDIRLAQALFERTSQNAELEALSQSRSITTFRFVPTDLALGDNKTVSYLDQLNLELLTRLQASGETYLSMRWSMENSPCAPAL